jgi:hypothetical protein
MNPHLTTTDLRRLGTAAKSLLTLPEDGNPVTWWRGVEPRLRELFVGSRAMLTFADHGRLEFVSESVSPAGLQVLGGLLAVDPGTGQFVAEDPAVETWLRYRRARGLTVWTERTNRVMLRQLGHDVSASEFHNAGLRTFGLADYCGLSSDAPIGEMFITIGYDADGMCHFGDAVSEVLHFLAPAFQAAHQALARGEALSDGHARGHARGVRPRHASGAEPSPSARGGAAIVTSAGTARALCPGTAAA